MLHPDFLYELFTYCNAAGLSCLIDSNGTIDFTEYRDLLDLSASCLTLKLGMISGLNI